MAESSAVPADTVGRFGLTREGSGWSGSATRPWRVSPEADARVASPKRVLSACPPLPRQVAPDDRSALWALLTFYGGACQLHLDRTCTHLVVPEPKGVSAHVPAHLVAGRSRSRVFF